MRLRLSISCCIAVSLAAGVADGVKKKVLLIGIDGAGGEYVVEANTPVLDTLAADGGARFDFLNEGALVPDPPPGYGASGVNWSTFLTGASAAQHGVVDNSFSGSGFDAYPHFFKHIKDSDSSLYTASLANWTPINTFITPDEFTDLEIGYDTGSAADQDVAVKDDAVHLLKSGDPDAVFLHFDHVDGAGHVYSWGSPQHIASIETVDGLIGEIVTALNGREGVVSGQEDWLVLVSADHGATRGGFGHYASQGPQNWNVPYVISGPSVQDGINFGQGTLRDLTATALWHMGIDPFLAGLAGTIRGLEVPAPNGVDGDINQDGVVFGDGSGPASTDDVTAFLDNWLVSGPGGVADRYQRGDLNFDGTTDLTDWAMLHDFSPSLANSVLHALRAAQAPEPGSLACLALACVASLLRRGRISRASSRAPTEPRTLE